MKLISIKFDIFIKMTIYQFSKLQGNVSYFFRSFRTMFYCETVHFLFHLRIFLYAARWKWLKPGIISHYSGYTIISRNMLLTRKAFQRQHRVSIKLCSRSHKRKTRIFLGTLRNLFTTSFQWNNRLRSFPFWLFSRKQFLTICLRYYGYSELFIMTSEIINVQEYTNRKFLIIKCVLKVIFFFICNR